VNEFKYSTNVFLRIIEVEFSFTIMGATEMGKRFNLPLAYDEKSDQESWEELKKLLASAL
jgi:hypothetical protein